MKFTMFRRGAKTALFRSTVAMYLLQIAKYIFPFITLPYLARVLETDGYAVRSYILSVMTFVTMAAEFGFMNYGIAKVIEGGLSSEATSRVTSSIMVARLAIFVPLSLCIAVMSALVPIMADNQAYVWISFLGVFFTSFIPDFIFRAYEQMEIITVRYVVSKGIAVILTFILIRSPDDLLLVPLLDLVTSLIAFGWSWIAAVRRFSLRFAPTSLRSAWHDFTCSAVYFVSSASTIVFSSLTTFLFGIFGGSSEDIAYWGVAMTVINGLAALYSPLSQSLYPYCLKRAGRGESISFRKMYAICLLPLTAGMAAMFFAAKPIMWVLGGDAYLPGSYVIAILSPLVIASFYVQLSGWPSLGAFGKVKELTRTTVISMIVHTALLGLLVVFTNYELYFVAAARVASEIVMALLRLHECRKAGIV